MGEMAHETVCASWGEAKGWVAKRHSSGVRNTVIHVCGMHASVTSQVPVRRNSSCWECIATISLFAASEENLSVQPERFVCAPPRASASHGERVEQNLVLGPHKAQRAPAVEFNSVGS